MPRYYVIELPDEAEASTDTIRDAVVSVCTDLKPAAVNAIKVTGADSPGGSWVLLQEGGSSTELYVHAHSQEGEAHDDRINCRDYGSYRTSPPVSVSPLLQALGEVYYESLDEVVALVQGLDYPEGERESDEEGEHAGA